MRMNFKKTGKISGYDAYKMKEILSYMINAKVTIIKNISEKIGLSYSYVYILLKELALQNKIYIMKDRNKEKCSLTVMLPELKNEVINLQEEFKLVPEEIPEGTERTSSTVYKNILKEFVYSEHESVRIEINKKPTTLLQALRKILKNQANVYNIRVIQKNKKVWLKKINDGERDADIRSK